MARKKPIPRSARKEINRGTLRSRGDDTVKNISVGLMDIDAAIMFYFNNVISNWRTDRFKYFIVWRPFF